MFIRFVTSTRDRPSRAERGLFGPAYEIRRAHSPATAPWQVHEIHREIGWFESHLGIPRTLTIQRNRHRGGRAGVCWFRDGAAEHVTHARYLAFLLGEMGEPVEILMSDQPGTVLWADAHQVVALPERDHPRVFQ